MTASDVYQEIYPFRRPPPIRLCCIMTISFCTPTPINIQPRQRPTSCPRNARITNVCRRATPTSCAEPSPRAQRTQTSREPTSSHGSAAELGQQLVRSGQMNQQDLKLFQMFTDSRADLFLRVLSRRTRHLTFVLDGVHGAHNLAAIARSCDAWGIQDLHLVSQHHSSEHRSAATNDGVMEPQNAQMSIMHRFENDKSIQNVSKNSHKWLTIQEHCGADACLRHLQSAGYTVLVSSLDPTATPLHQVNVSQKTALVFGHEMLGVSKHMIAKADGLFTIPMMGFVESMNVSVAVGTTASLLVTKSKQSIPEAQYNLNTAEKRKLAHTWLANRFSSHGTPRSFPGPLDLTRMGGRFERDIIEKGMFQPIHQSFCDPLNPQIDAFRLGINTGARLAAFVNRRKFGALGDTRFDKRCKSTTYFLAGSHALSCAAALAPMKSIRVTKAALHKYFQNICHLITDLYTPYFDAAGMPLLPTFAPESRDTFRNLSTKASELVMPVCIEFAKKELGLGSSQVYSLLASLSYQHIVSCITDTVQCSNEYSEAFCHAVTSTLSQAPQLLHILQQREPVRKLSANVELRTDTEELEKTSLPESHAAALQAFLRFSNAAYLSSEIHQAVWGRLTSRDHLERVHSLRFALPESVLCEAWAESVTVPALNGWGPLRMVIEWYQLLAPLKMSILKANNFDDQASCSHETEHYTNAASFVPNST